MYYLGQWGDQCVALYCFCAGYAAYLLQERSERTEYWKGTAKRLLRLLVNFWLIVCVFAVIGVFFDSSGSIPGSLGDFIGNVLLVRTTYNGAWWFMLTYMLLTLISGVLYMVCKRLNSMLVFCVAGAIYFVAYLVRFNKMSLNASIKLHY